MADPKQIREMHVQMIGGKCHFSTRTILTTLLVFNMV
uniref:Uncharacterized protein n=1 Tax=Arundo donax TaxID=35708 RepID=A0A0A9H3K9_ARUDO